MLILSSDLTAMPTGRETKAITTSLMRSQTLLWSGYKMRRLRAGIVEVKGQPTEHKMRTGGIRIDTHGPYTVDTEARTCTCAGFANRSICAHLPAAMEFHAAYERGESPTVRMVSISRELIALREIEGSRYHCQEGRIVVFRSWEQAGAYWDARPDLIEYTELVELTSSDLEELAATGRYAGLMLETGEGAQEIPLPELSSSSKPEVDWSARAKRIGAAKREDFD